ncbi:MAG: beta-lactamase family protein [Thermoleophilia bacterium]|nr:beta-lactamase family protein [Thermoleophilia bacterium]
MSPSIGIPRPPVGPDPFRRIKVPKDLEPITTLGVEAPAAAGGLDDRDVARIWSAAKKLFRSGVHPAVSLCVRREGEVVLDRSIGWARGVGPDAPDDAEPVLNTPDTPHVIFSASKALTASVAHLLDQQGKIHIDDRVAEYIPEYARHGKEGVTIAHVLSHRGGVPNLPGEAFKLENIDDRDAIVEMLVDAKPQSRPGTALAYHAISGGYIIGEIVHRVTGKSIREVLAEEILDPLGFRWTNYGVDAADVEAVATSHYTGAPVLPPLSNLLKRALGVSVGDAARLANEPEFLTGIIPSGNAVTTATELSRFFELLRRGGELDGVRIFEPRTLRRMLTEQSYMEIDFTLGFPTRFSLGMMLGAQVLSLYGPDTEHAFGHLGFTNIIGWADPERALSATVITSGKPVLYPELPILWNLMRTIGRVSPKVETNEIALAAVD